MKNQKPSKIQYKGRPVHWTTKTIFVDIDTAEEITRHNANTNYIKLKSERHVEFTNFNKTRGIIEYTIECRRKPKQGKLF